MASFLVQVVAVIFFAAAVSAFLVFGKQTDKKRRTFVLPRNI
jgi:hypothetical protein